MSVSDEIQALVSKQIVMGRIWFFVFGAADMFYSEVELEEVFKGLSFLQRTVESEVLSLSDGVDFDVIFLLFLLSWTS